MDKAQAIHHLWSSYGLPAYDEQTVPDNAQMPYITYRVSTASFENIVPLTASLWYRSKSWADITKKADAIAKDIGIGYKLIPCDNGYMRITQGSPFSQRVADTSNDVRRIYITIQAEFMSAY